MQLLSASMSGMIKDNSIPKYMQVGQGMRLGDGGDGEGGKRGWKVGDARTESHPGDHW